MSFINQFFIWKLLFCGWIILFFSYVFFQEHSRFTGQQGKGEPISLTLLYHFHLLHRPLDTGQTLAAKSSPLHIVSSHTRAGNLWFSGASCLCIYSMGMRFIFSFNSCNALLPKLTTFYRNKLAFICISDCFPKFFSARMVYFLKLITFMITIFCYLGVNPELIQNTHN